MGREVKREVKPKEEEKEKNVSSEPGVGVGEGQEVKGVTPPRGLDILHATSAALMNALREVLMDSDFENAMKALTAWIPIKDEEMLMRVARAEWKAHRGGGVWRREKDKDGG